MLLPSGGIKVYLAMDNTDMRKAINGFSILVEGKMNLGTVFIFTLLV